MRTNNYQTISRAALRVSSILLFGTFAAFGQQQVNLTAGPAGITTPDGVGVPMWSYRCGAAVSGSTATCAYLSGSGSPAAMGALGAVSVVNGGTGYSAATPPAVTITPVTGNVPTTAAVAVAVVNAGGQVIAINLTNPGAGYTAAPTVAIAAGSGTLATATAGLAWSPVLITVPTGQQLQVNLANNLYSPLLTGTGTTPINPVPTSLAIVGQLGGGLGGTATSTLSPDHTATQGTITWPIAGGTAPALPPPQGARVQSFAGEVAAALASSTAPVCTAPATTSAVAGCAALTWSSLRPGTYLMESGTHPSIQGPMGLYGMVVVTCAPGTATCPSAGTAYPAGPNATLSPAVTYAADVPLLFSEIDPVQNSSVNAAVNTANFSETMVWSGLPGGCGNPASAIYQQCYPPAVNYSPLYFLINGVAFDKTHSTNSLFASSPATGVAGNVLLRLVNAGLRMHVPAVVGSLTGTAPASTGFSLIAEDGNPLPGVHRVQSEVFMAAGKTYDVMINTPAAGPALPIFDRELSLSGNATARDAGMLAYVGVNSAGLPAAGAFGAAVARPDTYTSVLSCSAAPCTPVVVSDPAKGLIANDTNVYGVKVLTAPAGGTLTLATNGTFTYVPNVGTVSDSFTYQGNGNGPSATVTLSGAPIETGGISCSLPSPAWTSTVATTLSIKPPGVLAFCKDAMGYPLTISGATATTPAVDGNGVSVDQNGGFTSPGVASFSFTPKNSQGTMGAAYTVNLTFPMASNLAVSVVDGPDKAAGKITLIGDYRWVIEEDRTFYINPGCTTNPPPVGCPTAGGIVPTFGTNFHTSYMPVVATGCTGPLSCENGQAIGGAPVVCDVGNGVCRPGAQFATLDPRQVHLDPTKRYYISVLPGDAANSFENAGMCLSNPTPSCGHGMGGAPIACIPAAGVTCTTADVFPPVTVVVQPNPFPPSRLSVQVFEDDFPLNGEQDAGGGIDILATNEPGLGGFNITLFDDAGGTGDATGQMTYDMFNMPLSNSLAGTMDPTTGLDACPVSGANVRLGFDGATASPTGITGTIVTCPSLESDGQTPSPLGGQAVVANLMPGRYGVVATPAADRIARGEEWLQTNTLDGQKAHDSFLRVGEPSYFQEFGPAGYHVSIGFANPKIINGRLKGICAGADLNITGVTSCNNSVTGTVTTERMSRTPDERLYSSGDNSSFAFTQCYVSVGDPDGEDFAFTKCDSNGTFTLSGLPPGDWRVTVFDQWNDMLVDGLSTPVRLGGGTTANMGQIATNQWQANIYTTTFLDANGNGVRDADEQGLTLVATNNRFRDGSYSNFNNTDLAGYAGFNEIFPLFSWYVIETDTTRYKSTGVHVVYDAGGPADGTPCGNVPCGNSTIAAGLANTAETVSVPTNLRVPGAVYCASADCTGKSIASGPASSDPPSVCSVNGATGALTCSTQLSTGRIDPPYWFGSEGWQGFSGQNNFIEFGKKPYCAGTGAGLGKCGATALATAAENGGIHGEVIYASTRPFDDPTLLIHTSWTPDVPGVVINLYKEGTAPDGSTSLMLFDTTKTSSFDDWAQGFRSDGVTPNMNCPGQGRNTGPNGDLFFFSLYNQSMWLDQYNNGVAAASLLPDNAQFKCYDGMHNWNQVQPVPYDGMYSFPSVTAFDPTTGRPAGTNCSACVSNPDSTDPYRTGTPMLPAGKYVVEMIVPPGYELVKEEDKNILIGDNYIAPVTQQFAGLGNIFILPDQAEVNALYNANNAQNPTQTFGRTTLPSHEGDTGSVETFWPCVGASRVVPDFISLFPQSAEVSPFAGATRNLCDRKEVTLTDQSASLAKFWLFTSAHVAAHFTGVITDDFTSEFDPFSPQFGEKFSPANLPVSFKDWTGAEISRFYSDHWGAYDGLTYSTWEVNPPNPTGYAPTMMVTCMNDPGPILDTRVQLVNPTTGALTANPTYNTMITDPLYNPAYSAFCYEIPFMPGQTQYMDTPVVPTSAFAGAGYNNPDCDYTDATPAISEVDGDQVGPWVQGATFTSGSVTSVLVTAPGSGYSTAPTVGFTGGGGGSGAAGTAVVSSAVTALSITNHGAGYTSAPTVSITGGGGTGAIATVGLGFPVASATVTNGGSGYTSAPTVAFSAPGNGGTTAAGNAVLAGGVASVAVTSGGTYTSAPVVTFTGTGTGAAATATMRKKAASVTITNGGSYAATGTVTATFSGAGGGGTTATGTVTLATIAGGRRTVTGVTITNPGSYALTSTITVTISNATGPGGVRATATVPLAEFVSAIAVTAAGSGYQAPPAVGFTGGGGTVPATATSTLTAAKTVSSVTITNFGAGYTSAPTVSFSGGAGSGAAATTTLGTAGGVYTYTLISGGSGYTSAPTVTLTGGGYTTLASVTASASTGVTAVMVTNPGSGYTSAPTVTFTGGGGTGTTAQAILSAAPGGTGLLTITSLGDQMVNNYGYTGPSATVAPYNQKNITRHYGFGARGSVTIGGVNASILGWSDQIIQVSVPSTVPSCAVQQQTQYGGSPAKCGQLVITSGNGKQSVDAVTVTVGGKAPTHVAAADSVQAALDAANPGDLIMVDPTCTNAGLATACTAPSATNVHAPGAHNEILIMWKPVRLQGVGAASSIINANTHPSGANKLDPWRRQVNCLFGLAINGQPNTGTFDPGGIYSCPGNGWTNFSGGPNYPLMVADRIPLEGILGWDATVNGNLAEQLQEPSLMGAYEGAGITVLAKGVNIPAGADPATAFGAGAEAAFPAGSLLLTAGDCATGVGGANLYPTNYLCNPSSIDGLTVTNSSQGGGGIFAHAWAHNLQIGNNRIHGNAGTLSGGISIGQGESPEAYLNGSPSDSDPGSCLTPGAGQTTNTAYALNTQLPYCENLNVNVHHNYIVRNSSTGDELFTGTPAGAGGVSICTGADYYKFNYNWVCGNISTGDGGGVGHIGFSWNGDIEHNTFLFNQSANPTIQSNGGGLLVMGAAPDGQTTVAGVTFECGSVTDNDCVPGLSDGTGPGLIINANLFMGNSAESGSGGGIRLQAVNGTDVPRFPANPERWYSVSITNNIITDNVAGWDGAGISLEDALVANIVNNTISSNDTTASAGPLFNTLGAPIASSQSPLPVCQSTAASGGTASCPQPAGLVVFQNSPQLISSFSGLDANGQPITPAVPPLPNGNCPNGTTKVNGSCFSNAKMTVICPAGHFTGTGSGAATNGTCTQVSYPILYNNIFWQNRDFHIQVGALGAGTLNQQNVVSLVPSLNQATTGQCVTGASFWDIGVRNDTGPTNHGSGFILNPLHGVLSPGVTLGGSTGYSTTNLTSNPLVVSQYCNGSRVPPENGGLGYDVPAGIADATVPNPIFNLAPAATVDEGNNWINMSWGPLSMVNPATNVILGNYALGTGSPDINAIACNAPNCTPSGEILPVPPTDYFGNPRPSGNAADIGAIESGSTLNTSAPSLAEIIPNLGSVGTTVPVTLNGANLTGGTIAVSGTGVTATGTTVVNSTQITANFVITTGAALGNRSVTVTTGAGTSNAVTFTIASVPAPILNQLNPITGPRGLTTTVTLGGSGFPTTGTVINLCRTATGACVAPANITVDVPVTVPPTPPAPANNTPCIATYICTVTDSSTIEVGIAVGPTAGLGVFYIGVTTPSGVTVRLPFTVTTAPAPTIAGITPASGARGTIITVVSITGANFTSNSTLSVSGTGVTLTPILCGTGVTANYCVVDSGTIEASFTIAANATLGNHNVTVTSAGGAVSTPFAVVNPPAPTLTSLDGNVGTAGTTVAVVLNGTNLTFGSTIAAGAGITVSGITPDPAGSGTFINANFRIANNAALGARNVTVTTPGGTSNVLTFTVQ